MSKHFNPTINQNAFSTFIIETQQQVANNQTVVNTIANKIGNEVSDKTYQAFIDICSDYDVEFTATLKGKKVKVAILANKLETLKMEYDDQDRDISTELAQVLYHQLFSQILNQLFLNETKANS